eukprot:2031139-Pleurochrysis_carterae.AAC.5
MEQTMTSYGRETDVAVSTAPPAGSRSQRACSCACRDAVGARGSSILAAAAQPCWRVLPTHAPAQCAALMSAGRSLERSARACPAAAC